MKKVLTPDLDADPGMDRRIANGPKDIPGWGHDANPENDPTYPMKNWNGADHERLNYERPEQQPADIEILHSNERPGLTAVFGTSTPPDGLSGKIRRYAFRHSESSYAHWVPLILADRVGVVEGLIEDFKKGIIPNIFAEKGWKGEWKYNRKGFMQNAALGIAVASALILWFSRSSKKHIA